MLLEIVLTMFTDKPLLLPEWDAKLLLRLKDG
jgi:hypothetical protein